VRRASLDDGIASQTEINMLVEHEAALRYRRDHFKPYELTLQLAQDILDAPESIDDVRVSQFIDGFNFGDRTLMIPVYGGIKSMHNSIAINRAANKDGKLNETEKMLLAMNSMNQQMEKKVKDLNLTYFNIGKATSHSLAWMGEIVATSPGFIIGKQAMKAALKTSFRKGNYMQALKGKKLVLPKKTPAHWSKHSKKAQFNDKIVEAVSVMAGAVTQTAMSPQRVIDELTKRMTGEHVWALSDLSEQAISIIDAYTYSSEEGKELGLKGPTESFGEAFLRSFGVTWSEMFTERLGAYFPSLFKRPLRGTRKAFSKTPLGKTVNNIDFWKKTALGRYMRKLRLKPGKKFNEAIKLVGWHGILSEIGEELVNFPLSNLIDGNTPIFAGIRKYDEFGKDQGWDTQSLKELVGSVSVMGGAFYGLGTVSSKVLGYEQQSYGVDNTWFDNKEKAIERLKQLKKEGRLTSDIEIEVRNDWVAHGEILKIVQDSLEDIPQPQQLQLPKLNLPDIQKFDSNTKLQLPKLNKV